MPRTGPMLVLFLEKSVAKYKNLSCEDPVKRVFSLYLPRRGRKLDREYEYIFKDWYAKTGRKYTFFQDYTRAKQAMTAALRKSDYIELMKICEATLTFRILNEEEVQAKKQLKKSLKGKQQEESETSESGYDSAMNSPESRMDYEQNDEKVLRDIVHDHPYDKTSGEENGFEFLDVWLGEDFLDIPKLSEDVSIEDLDQIPQEELIEDCLNQIPSEMQAPDLTGAEARVNLYICKKHELLDNGVLLICKLLQEEDVCVADTTSNIKIIFDEALMEELQGYSHLKKWEKIDDHNLMVILEPPFTSQKR